MRTSEFAMALGILVGGPVGMFALMLGTGWNRLLAGCAGAMGGFLLFAVLGHVFIEVVARLCVDGHDDEHHAQ